MSFCAEVRPEIPLHRDSEGAKLSICYFEGGEFEGSRIRGRLLPGGGDWATYYSEDFLDIDVRCVLETDDGATIFMEYHGCWWAKPGVLPQVLAEGGDVRFRSDDYYLRTVSRFETPDKRYRWLNRLIALGIGARTSSGVSYEFFEIL